MCTSALGVGIDISGVKFSLHVEQPIRMIAWWNAPRGHSSTMRAIADWLGGNERGHSSVIVGAILLRWLRDR
jgi:hypothetical protein